MAKHTQIIRRQIADFMGLALKGLMPVFFTGSIINLMKLKETLSQIPR